LERRQKRRRLVGLFRVRCGRREKQEEVRADRIVAVEEPGYPAARLLFESHGARVTPVAVDGNGLDVGALPDDARLVYVTPSHQFPLGMPMSHSRRVALHPQADARSRLDIRSSPCPMRSPASIAVKPAATRAPVAELTRMPSSS
jgi:hypothetical protein